MRAVRIGLVASAAVAAGIVAVALRHRTNATASPSPASQEANVVRESVEPTRTATAQPAAAAPVVRSRRPEAPAANNSTRLELPDGTFVSTLNGAVDAAPITDYWGNFPWSPIVGVERSAAGVDWYRHEDGSYSTTQMVWRSDLGRMAAMTRVAHPGPAPAAPAPAR